MWLSRRELIAAVSDCINKPVCIGDYRYQGGDCNKGNELLG